MADGALLVQLSDLHILPNGLLHDRVDTMANLEWVLAALVSSGERPDALILSGDLADGGQPAAYERLRRAVEPVAERLGATVVYVPGNHDDRDSFARHLLDRAGSDGPIDQVAECDGLRIIALDSTVVGRPHGELSDAQLHGLATRLERPAPKGTVLVVHHPPIPSPLSFLDSILLRRPERLGEVIRGTDVRLVLAGHTHHTTSGLLGGVPVWVATATAYQADAMVPGDLYRGVPGSAFSRVDLVEGQTLVTQVPVWGSQAPIYEITAQQLNDHLAVGESAPVGRPHIAQTEMR